MAAPYAPPPADPRRKAAALGTVLVSLFLAAQALDHRAWIKTDTRPPAWSDAVHLELALETQTVMRPPLKPGAPPFPPLHYLLMRPLMKSMPPADAALWLNWIYLVVLAFSTLAMALYFRPDMAAPACALLIAAAPGTMALMHAHLLDLGVMAWAALAYCALVYSDGLRRWPWTAAFAAAFVLGMLHKWSLFLYMLPALYHALRCADKPESRVQAWTALAAILLLSAPWYLANAGVLFPRLLAAAGGFDLTSFAGLSAARYLLDLVSALGPLFWAFGLIGLLVPQYHRAVGQGWLMTAWFISSYVVWTLIPNRQIRFIMPAATALSLAGTGAWPTQLLWTLAIIQVVGAFNYNHAWISEFKVPMPFQEMTFFASDPARAEDWRIEDVLRAAGERHQLDHRVAVLAVAAGHERFNPSSFAYAARRLKSVIEPVDAAVSGVGLAEFVLVKAGGKGPVHALAADRKSWFSRAYEKASTWRLPDGSEAALYQQARSGAPPLKGDADFQYYTTPDSKLEAENVKLVLGPWDPASASYRSATITGSNVKLRGLDLGRVEVELREAVLAPSYGPSGALEELRLLRVAEVDLKRIRISPGAVKVLLESWLPGLHVSGVRVGTAIEAAGRYRGVALAFSAVPRLGQGELALELTSAKMGPLNVGPGVMASLASFRLPLGPTARKPFLLTLPGVTLTQNALSVP